MHMGLLMRFFYVLLDYACFLSLASSCDVSLFFALRYSALLLHGLRLFPFESRLKCALWHGGFKLNYFFILLEHGDVL